MKNAFFDEIHYRFGFGCMRLPMKGSEVDIAQTREMVDLFIEEGFNYFDTAHGYLDGKSELALKECLTKRYPRESYIIVDKLTHNFFKTEEDIRPFFESQLEAVGVDYFDFYLLHAQSNKNYGKYRRCRAYETIFDLKKEGKIRHVGISFHDSPKLLERILTDFPEIEVVQIQLNYLDFDNPAIQSRLCYEVCEKYGKPAIIMEPVKGGSLVNLPEPAQKVIDELGGEYSNAGYALRFAAGFPGVMMVLSGMSSIDQLRENIVLMKDVKPLTEEENEVIKRVAEAFNSMGMIPCTSCRYCVEENHCPKDIIIPALFADYNAKKFFHDWNSDFYYTVHTVKNGKASDCIKCGMCERACPQQLEIRKLLEEVAGAFEEQ